MRILIPGERRLTVQRVLPVRLEAQGYRFKYPKLAGAMLALLGAS